MTVVVFTSGCRRFIGPERPCVKDDDSTPSQSVASVTAIAADEINHIVQVNMLRSGITTSGRVPVWFRCVKKRILFYFVSS